MTMHPGWLTSVYTTPKKLVCCGVLHCQYSGNRSDRTVREEQVEIKDTEKM